MPILESPLFARVVEVLRLRAPAAAVSDAIAAGLGLVLNPTTVTRFVDAVQLPALVRASLQTVVLVLGLFAVFFLAETLVGAGRSHYRTRVFVQDVLYAFFYQGGFYTILLWAGVANALGQRLAFLRIDVLSGLPGPVHWVLYWLVVDFITYWWHRLLHSWGPLWAIHSVHHTQAEMSFISSYRLHPLEQLFQNLIMVVPLLVLGVPTFSWLPLYALMNLFEAAQHSALPWGYGKAYYVFVSPVFHSVHHSSEARHHNRNFAKILSLWDFVFGTGLKAEQRPARFGVDGLPVPATLWQQFLAPFRILGGRGADAAQAPAKRAVLEPGG